MISKNDIIENIKPALGDQTIGYLNYVLKLLNDSIISTQQVEKEKMLSMLTSNILVIRDFIIKELSRSKEKQDLVSLLGQIIDHKNDTKKKEEVSLEKDTNKEAPPVKDQ